MYSSVCNNIFCLMSTAIKWVLAVLVIVALAWIAWWSGCLGGMMPKTSSTTQTSAVANVASAVPVNTNGMSTLNDTSDAAIAQDVGAVDIQLQGLLADSTSVDVSASDKPVAQAY